ncbi:MAG: CDP-diacylglycerol--serine O-phosphatidyltransferase [Candidatus Glassbacteria bacterium]
MRVPRKSYFLPSAFTAGNVLCGFFSLVSAMRGDLHFACWLIVVAGVLDFADGKVAMFSHSESRFGIELDSLADIISFGIAPGVIMYQFFLRDRGEWSWMVAFIFVLCGALRLARFNVETTGAKKTKFKGLPIPMAAACLISFVPFCTTGFFRTVSFNLNYSRFLVFLILILAGLMVSNVEYPVAPRLDLRTFRGISGFVLGFLFIFVMIYYWDILLFPFSFLYVAWGLLRAIVLGAVSRLPEKGSNS